MRRLSVDATSGLATDTVDLRYLVMWRSLNGRQGWFAVPEGHWRLHRTGNGSKAAGCGRSVTERRVSAKAKDARASTFR